MHPKEKLSVQELLNMIDMLELELELTKRHLSDMRKIAIGTVGTVDLEDEKLMGPVSTNAPRQHRPESPLPTPPDLYPTDALGVAADALGRLAASDVPPRRNR
jgi:hypothetical protein